METVNSFFNDAIVVIVAVLSLVVSILGVQLKNSIVRKLDTETKVSIAKTVVNACEQLYKDLHGEKKLGLALHKMREMLDNCGIDCWDEDELRSFIESAVRQMNTDSGTLLNELISLDGEVLDTDDDSNHSVNLVSTVEELETLRTVANNGDICLVGEDPAVEVTQYTFNNGEWINDGTVTYEDIDIPEDSETTEANNNIAE
jgi:hypothetical protein